MELRSVYCLRQFIALRAFIGFIDFGGLNATFGRTTRRQPINRAEPAIADSACATREPCSLSCRAARRTRHRILSARANPSYMYQSCSIRITTGNPPCFSSKYSGQHRFPQKLKFPGTPWSVSYRVADHTQHHKRTTSRPSWSFCRSAGRVARGTQPGRH